MQEQIPDPVRKTVAAPAARSAYRAPTLMALGSFASVTRMMTNGPYADGMLGLMPVQM